LEEQGVFLLLDSPVPDSFATFYDKTMLRKAIASSSHCDIIGGWVQPKGTFIKGPIKNFNRAIAKIYRAYAGNFRRITDIVRCTVVLDSIEDIGNFMIMLNAIGWVERYEIDDVKKRVRQGENPLNFSRWSVISGLQKLYLMYLFMRSFFMSRFLGLPREDVVNARRGAFQIVRVKNRFAEDSPVGGYRDVNIKVRVGFKPNYLLSSPVFVPVEKWDDSGVQTVVCEIQVWRNDSRLLILLPVDDVSGALTGPFRRHVAEHQSA
jgi:hypothetical protein